MSGGRTSRVVINLRAPAGQPDRVVAAYHQVSATLADTPGLVGNELWQSCTDPEYFVVVSRWDSLAAFQQWEGGTDHRDSTAPLRQFQGPPPGQVFAVFEVIAEYSRTTSLDAS
jgi:heme oxygenase (mycobilin-producing)